MTTTERPTFDLLDPDFYGGDPHSAYRWMRTNEPVYRDEANGLWGITRHADIAFAERHSDTFVSSQGYRANFWPEETNMIALDDPVHAEQRGLVARRFTPKAVRQHQEWLRTTVRSLVDDLVEAGSDGDAVEVVDALAAQLPCRLTARLLGWDEARWPDIKRWSEQLMQIDRMLVDPEAMAGVAQAIMEFSADLAAMAEERRGCPVDDLVSVWANAEVADEPFDASRLVHETGLTISGGAETTRTAITRGLRLFCDHGDQWEALHDDPALIPGAVEELVRWVTPLHNMFRTAATDTELGGQPLAEGDRLVLLYPSANRDEAVFDDPDAFDITRSPNPHLGFGQGTHFCLGASLARLELGIVLQELVPRITELRVVDEVVDEPQVFAWSARAFGLGFDPR